VLVGVVAVVLVALTGWQALRAKDSLALVAADFDVLTVQLTAGETDEARRTLRAVQRNAEAARDNTDGPGWGLTSAIPGVGANIDAVRTVARVTDRLAREVLPDVVLATDTLKPQALRPQDGQVDLVPIEQVAPLVVRADRRLQDEVEGVADLDPDALAPQIGNPVEEMQEELAAAAVLSDRASRTVQLLPAMLGAESRRDYLLLFQNNAEVRATGGIPGSFAVVTAEDGRVTLGQQGDAATVGFFEEPPVPLTEDEVELFTENLGRFPQDVNFTPDFPRSARLIQAMWNARHGLQVDGVLSADPVALSYLLEGTGPLPLDGGAEADGAGTVGAGSDGAASEEATAGAVADGALAGVTELTAENAVPLLLSTVYDDLPVRQQNPFFDSVAGTVFDAVADGRGDPGRVLEGLVRGAEERRILVWSSIESEQRLLAPTKVGGTLRTEPTPGPLMGVFLNDGTAAKMSYYLDATTSLTSVRCQADRQYLTTEITLTSTAPTDPAVAAGLSDYVTG
jgi:hypothetical protein